MADTFGGLIDKLITVDMKMWDNQEILYEVRRLTFDEFKTKYVSGSDEDCLHLYNSIKKCCDLNVQRGQLVDEIDEKLVEMFEALKSGQEMDAGKYIQRKHKTY